MFLLTDQIQRPYRSFDSKFNKEHYLVNIPLGRDRKLSTPSGVVKGQSILNKFTSLTTGFHQSSSFDSLPIPFACVAGDLVAGKEVVIRTGDLPLAMRTSMSVPGVFEPVYRDGMALIDGGVFNNFPVDVCKKMGADITIGVDLSTEAFRNPDYKDLMEIANRITFLLGEEKYRKNKQEVTLYMNPGLKGYTSADFKPEAIDTMIAMGERIARLHWDQIMKLKKSIGEYTYIKNDRRNIQKKDNIIDEIRFDGLETINEKSLYRLMKIKPKKNILFSEAEELSFILQGLELFDSVSYSILENEEGKQILVFTVHEKNKGNIGIGIHMNTEDIASVLLNAEGIVGERKKHNISATAKINKNAWLNLDYNLRIKDMNRLGLAYNISYTDFKVRDHSEDMGYLSYLNNHFEMYIRNDSYRDLRYKFGVQYDWFNNISSWYTTDYTSHEMRNDHFLSCRMDLEYDKMDNREIPTSGVNVRFTPEVYVNGVFGNDCYMFTPFTFRVKAAYSANSRICILPEVFGRFVMGDKMSPLFNNFVGGECYDRYISGHRHSTEYIIRKFLRKWH